MWPPKTCFNFTEQAAIQSATHPRRKPRPQKPDGFTKGNMGPWKRGGSVGQKGTTGIQDLDEGGLERARVLLGVWVGAGWLQGLLRCGKGNRRWCVNVCVLIYDGEVLMTCRPWPGLSTALPLPVASLWLILMFYIFWVRLAPENLSSSKAQQSTRSGSTSGSELKYKCWFHFIDWLKWWIVASRFK